MSLSEDREEEGMASRSKPCAEAGTHIPPSPRRRPLWKLPICWLHLCGHKANSDATGCWGECVTCGHRAGFVGRAVLRAYADREIARDAAEIDGLCEALSLEWRPDLQAFVEPEGHIISRKEARRLAARANGTRVAAPVEQQPREEGKPLAPDAAATGTQSPAGEAA